MNQIASPGQLRLAYLRWALVTVPAILFLGFLSGRLANSGYGNRWFAALAKPELIPPGWVFGAAWTLLYILMALAFAMVLHARGARGRGVAITLFLVQFALNLIWSPLFFRAHQVGDALVLILVLTVLVAVTTALFRRIRRAAGWLLLPYLLWLAFAAYLNYEIDRLNPDAETLVVPALRTQI
ncbi:tryptophan-rich sensory protein [Sphingobium wenxiniae]|jgi:tryptophan-rich sensory protein|uniref:TspO/MBR related protein n=1 Tax=Sphingobium wenxiniae (strain DSM 21828 / CGMCC 1.7748 / JZ-1) TaxID=595605 RepID=A0A562KJ00_SPHWJ|nr:MULTISPECIES: TspO/MBR family protein [Sphingobium]MBB6190488.1 tryptophan-rich sensory protein [Sphingobium wenxiniae]TWH95203.1 TspO/MBR related protein [Sphingobium wenxiniae]WRD78300.1 TspO/MBR family protein [Sphingobium baderi]